MDEALHDEVRGWFTKASRDLQSARKLASEPGPFLDTGIYHCQQAAEKAIKGWLALQGIRSQKTHDIRSLIAEAAESDPRFNAWLEAGQFLTPYATAFRYPDEQQLAPDRAEFDEAYRYADSFLGFVTSLLPPELRSAQ